MSDHEIEVHDEFWAIIDAEYKIPPNSRTVKEFAERTGRTYASAAYQLTKMVEEGKLDVVKILNKNYYYPKE